MDRKALPEPDFGALVGSGEPRTETEAMLAAVVAEVLGLDRVGVDDDFFTLGGDSIVSIQLVTRARAADVRITARQVFELRTVAALAAAHDTPADTLGDSRVTAAAPETCRRPRSSETPSRTACHSTASPSRVC